MAVTISAKQVNELRQRTGVGLMKCKEALVKTEGDMEEAVTLLREQGLAAADKKANRIAAEGAIAIYNGADVRKEHKCPCISDKQPPSRH